jgi:hypothetical protein
MGGGGLKSYEIYSWNAINLITSFFAYQPILQVIFGFLQIIAYYLLLKALRINKKLLAIAVVTLPISSSFVLATDWYLRQGAAWAFLMISFSFWMDKKNIYFNKKIAIIFAIISVVFHSASLFYILIFIFSNMFYKFFEILVSLKFNAKAFVVVSLFIGVSLVLPFKMGYQPELNFIISGTHLEIYKNLDWGVSYPGFLFSIYMVIALYLIRQSKKVQEKDFIIISGFLLLVVLLSNFLMIVNSLSSRFLIPIPIFYVAALFALQSRMNALNIVDNYQDKKITLFFTALIFIMNYIFVIVDNGGMER